MWKMRIKTGCDRTRWFGVPEFHTRPWLTILGILLCMLSRPSAAAEPNTKNVLVLFSSVKYSESFLDTVEPSIRGRVPGPITFYNAYLDDPQVEQRSYRDSMAETLRRRYDGVKMDVVIACNPAAIYFAAEYHDKIFPGVPIVFIAINKRELELKELGPGVTGVVTPLGFRETIDLILRLQPKTNAVAVVAGVSSWDSRQLEFIHSELLRYRDKVTEIDLVGAPNQQMIEKVAALPPHAVVLFQTFPQFSDRLNFGTWDLLAAVAQSRPTYSVFPRLCVSGCIGGAYEYTTKEWLQTAELAARILLGERPENIPIVYASDLQITVDWRALRRWHIPESALPPGSVILYREPTLWERDRKYILAGIALIVAQAFLIIGLLWQRARKRRAESGLRESEERFRAMADTAPSLVWMCDAQGRITYLNEQRIAFTGPDPKGGYGDTWTGYIHPDDLKNVLDTVSRALITHQPFSTEYRLRRSDGTYRWMFDVASPRVNGDGSFGGFIGSAIDTTDQKLAQQALEKVSGQLIEAQEKERARIARDLHDDICQRLALLSMELEQANRSASGPTEATKRSLDDIQKHCSEIAGDVQSLSHQLHSSKLDYLGIVAAIRGFSKEFSQQHQVNVEFSERNVPAHMAKDVSLCLFRVAQEALHNAVKYSGVSQFTVELTGMEDAVQLVVSDAGAGFDVEAAKKKRGLGLLSMQERIHLVHGSFSVESQPWQGTRIIAAVPLVAEKEWSLEDVDVKEPTSVPGMV